MLRSKIFTVITVVIFLCGAATLNFAVAGEKIKWHGTGVTTKFEQIEVGDEDGHVLAIMVAKQIFIDEKTGEKRVSISTSTVDINLAIKQINEYFTFFSQSASQQVSAKIWPNVVYVFNCRFNMNPKAGFFIVNGYGVSTAPNGDKLVRSHEGKAIGKGHLKGTFTWTKGTGQWEDVKGGGTWESWSLAPDISYYEVEDIRE